MRLTRCKDQPSKTLDEFYGEVARENNQTGRAVGKAMLGQIAHLRSRPDDRQVFGLTSHYRLVLLAEDTFTSPWFVRILALNEQEYQVEFLLPPSSAPWPGAKVTGECRSEQAAVSMIETAMERSGGWSPRPPTA